MYFFFWKLSHRAFSNFSVLKIYIFDACSIGTITKISPYFTGLPSQRLSSENIVQGILFQAEEFNILKKGEGRPLKFVWNIDQNKVQIICINDAYFSSANTRVLAYECLPEKQQQKNKKQNKTHTHKKQKNKTYSKCVMQLT